MNKGSTRTYESQEIEDGIYQFWLSGGCFHAETDPQKDLYTVVIPPSNIIGQLHVGHALNGTLQDILTR